MMVAKRLDRHSMCRMYHYVELVEFLQPPRSWGMADLFRNFQSPRAQSN